VTTAGGSSGGLFSRLRRAVESAVGGSGSSSSSSDPSAATANKKRPLTTSASEEHDWDDGVDDPFAGSALASNPSTTTAEAAAAANPEETAAAAAAAHLDAARERLRDLERERDLLNRQSTYDFGPDDAWLPLAGECAETLGGHFTYRVCLFDAAHQVDGSGAETSLGKWQGIEVGDAHQGAEAVFSGGDWCQNGPARSLRAKLVCGSDFEVSGASEPATCVYSATVTLPQACTAAGLEQLEEAVRELDAEQARLAEEIAADEAARRAEAEAEAAGAGGGGSGAHDEL
jgi:protein kinase C substrate 80K-H